MKVKKFLKRTVVKNNKWLCVVGFKTENLPDNTCRQMGKTMSSLFALDNVISTKIAKRVK